jgi:hypothetical protein
MSVSKYLIMLTFGVWLPFIFGTTSAGEMFICLFLSFILSKLYDIHDEIKKGED